MEKLIVKNFGPIKEAEIDLTKFVVFIGDTSTGKSVLGKLISIFRDPNFAFYRELHIFKKLLLDYNIDFNLEKSYFEFFINDTSIKIENEEILTFENGKNFETKNTEAKKIDLIKLIDKLNIKLTSSNNDFEPSENTKKFETYLKSINHKETIYFPAERILNSIVGNSISGLWANNVALPNYYKNFAAKYEVARKEIKNIDFKEFGFEYVFENGEDKVQFKDVKLILSQSSSGIQSLVPLLILFEYSLLPSEIRLDKSFLIEEPELNLYPIKQKLLMEYLVQKVNQTDDKLVITTHSPYILSSLDTLMLAKNTFDENPDLKEDIAAIISEDKWLDYNDLSVYEVRNDGKVYSIKNDEFKSIDTNAIDSVSDVISNEFDKLTDLRYATH